VMQVATFALQAIGEPAPLPRIVGPLGGSGSCAASRVG
jgi:hypothetical protein